MNINFTFVRHGYGCHNSISNLVKNNIITRNEGIALMKNENEKINYNLNVKLNSLKDPELTPIGVDASIYNGCIISKILKSIYKVNNDPKLIIDKMNIVGCSPLIRCMETAYYMTRKWVNPPNKIYIFPFLREIDEGSEDKYSLHSIRTMNSVPSYAIKSIGEQKEYLKNLGILDFFDFSFVERNQNLQNRNAPGDIPEFLEWFNNEFLPLVKTQDHLNVFITTHAGVLKDYSEEGFTNNSGFVINTTYKNDQGLKINTYVSLNDFLPRSFFKDYSNPLYNNKKYYCPSNRCGQLCEIAKGTELENENTKISSAITFTNECNSDSNFDSETSL